MSRFNWSALMRAGITEGGLRPAEFWALSPAELLVVLGRQGSGAPMSRSRFEDLAAQFPDAADEGTS